MDADFELALALAREEHDCVNLQCQSYDNQMFENQTLMSTLPFIEDPQAHLFYSTTETHAKDGTNSSDEPMRGSSSSGGGGGGNDDDAEAALNVLKEEEANAMGNSLLGIAWNFVNAIIQARKIIVDSISSSSNESERNLIRLLQPEMIGVDDLLYTTERLLETQSEFMLNVQPTGDNNNNNAKDNARPTHVDIGCHHTKSSNLDSIKENGLMTKAEREQESVSSNYNGSAYGDGIYTGNHPFAYCNYGDTCLFVARLRGRPGRGQRNQKLENDCTIVYPGTPNEMVILAQSNQCIPLLKLKSDVFWSASSQAADISNILHRIHVELQYVVDCHFNDGTTTSVPEYCQSLIQRQAAANSMHVRRTQARFGSRNFTRPATATATNYNFSSQTINYPPNVAVRYTRSTLDSRQYIKDCKPTKTKLFQRETKKIIPIFGPNNSVSTQVQKVTEKMLVKFYPSEKLKCDGHPTLVVVYTFVDTQDNNNSAACSASSSMKEKHATNPGHTKSRTTPKLTSRITYHPFTVDQCKIVRRLAVAFDRGLLNSISWPLLPHRTNPYQTCKGHEEACQRAMDELGFPSTDYEQYAKYDLAWTS